MSSVWVNRKFLQELWNGSYRQAKMDTQFRHFARDFPFMEHVKKVEITCRFALNLKFTGQRELECLQKSTTARLPWGRCGCAASRGMEHIWRQLSLDLQRQWPAGLWPHPNPASHRATLWRYVTQKSTVQVFNQAQKCIPFFLKCRFLFVFCNTMNNGVFQFWTIKIVETVFTVKIEFTVLTLFHVVRENLRSLSEMFSFFRSSFSNIITLGASIMLNNLNHGLINFGRRS